MKSYNDEIRENYDYLIQHGNRKRRRACRRASCQCLLIGLLIGLSSGYYWHMNASYASDRAFLAYSQETKIHHSNMREELMRLQGEKTALMQENKILKKLLRIP